MRADRAAICTREWAGDRVTAYCFGDLSPEDEVRRFERHLLYCDSCWAEVQHLTGHVAILASDKSLGTTISQREIVGVLGTSASLERPFAGHWEYAATVSLLYGLEFGLSVWTELGYSYDRFSILLWSIWLPVLTAIAVAMAAALWIDSSNTRKGGSAGLVWSATMIISAVAVVNAAML